MNSLRFVSRRNIHQIRQFHKCIIQQADAATTTASEATASASVDSSKSVDVSPKIDQIANQIIALNLIEVSQLSDVLKTRLNLPDAPMIPMGGFAAAAAPAEDEDSTPQVVQTSFSVKLTGFDETKKITLIKELKNILPDCNLVQAKKFVDGLPGIIQANVVREEADKLKAVITAAGGVVEIE